MDSTNPRESVIQIITNEMTKGPGIIPIPMETLLVDPDNAHDVSCVICMSLLVAPKQCRNGHLFCSSCISLHIQKNPTCPQCRCQLKSTDLGRNLFVEKELNKFKVWCKNHFCRDEENKDWVADPEGCNEVSMMENASIHERNCEYTFVKCRYNAKCEGFRKKDTEKHEKKCPYRPVDCQYCKQLIEKNRLDDHQNNECKMIPTICSKCNFNSKRGEVELHRKNICPEEMISCNFQGCDAKFLRKYMQEHLKEDAGTHLFLLRKSFDEQLLSIESKFEKDLKVRDDRIKNLEKSLQEFETRVEWKVKNWSNLKKKSYLQSDKFVLSDFSWFIGFYTDGDNEDSRGFISVYLFMDMNSMPKNKTATVEFQLKFVNHKDYAGESIKKEFKAVFPIKGGQGWGDRNAVKSSRLTEEAGFVKQDTLTLEAQISLKKITWTL